MSGVQRVTGITGANIVSEHELWTKGTPFLDAGGLIRGLYNAAEEDKKNLDLRAKARSDETGEPLAVARQVCIAEDEKKKEDNMSFGEVLLLLLFAPILILSFFLGDE